MIEPQIIFIALMSKKLNAKTPDAIYDLINAYGDFYKGL